MRGTERSWWTLGMLGVVLAFLLASLYLPWYTYTYSEGRPTAPGAPANETRRLEVREARYYHPYELRGNVTPEQRANATEEVTTLGYLVTAGIVATLVNLVLEFTWGLRDWVRWVGMTLGVLNVAACVGALVWVWFEFPPTLADEGVRGVFTSRYLGNGEYFIRTTVDWGWGLGGLAALGTFAYLGFRFSSGAFDVGGLEYVKANERRR